MNRLPLLALVLLGVGALLFDLTLPLRLPGDEDWAEAAAALRARSQPGDAVQLWPPWAERARLFVDAAPVLAEEDLAQADYAGVRTLWLLALPAAPHAGLERARQALQSRGAAPRAGPQRFGALSLEPWDLRAAKLLRDLTPSREEHEIDYVFHRCVQLPIGASLPLEAEGATLHVRAGIIGERAYDVSRPPIAVAVRIAGREASVLEVPPTVPPQPGWRKLDLPLAAGPQPVELSVSSPDRDRPFCVSAWTTQP